jgi:hypothetical protein
LREYSKAGKTPAHSTVMTGAFRGCNHPWSAGARADFKSCESAARPAGLGFVAPQGGFQDPLWISCAMGCCVNETGGGG